MCDTWVIENGKFVKATKWKLFKGNFIHWFSKWKIINLDKYSLFSNEKRRNLFVLSDKELEEADKIYEEKGTISYIFYPCGGIGWGVKVKVLKTGEEIDITDINTW